MIFAEAARDAGVRRIVYLGGLGAGSDLPPHLASRQEVGRLLASTGVETIELRASIVIGLRQSLLRQLLSRIIDALVDSFFPIVADFDDRIDELENQTVLHASDAQYRRSS